MRFKNKKEFDRLFAECEAEGFNFSFELGKRASFLSAYKGLVE